MTILVIRLGALGDFVQSFGPFAAIRAHHPAARIELLTTAPYAGLGRRAPWFDAVRVDARPGVGDLRGLVRLRRQLRGHDVVYDLQTSARSRRYFWLAGRPAWSGIGRFVRYPHADPGRDLMHTRERQLGQLRAAGIADFPVPELGWLDGPAPAVAGRYALVVPGAAVHRPEKRWAAGRFGELAREMAGREVVPVIVGTGAEAAAAGVIRAACAEAVDLTGRTDLFGLARLARGAAFAVGNDTGPMHLAAAAGCACVVLFGQASRPGLTAPRMPDGGWPTVVQADDLADLTVARVAAVLP